MESQRLNELAEKYWKASCSEEEEAFLKDAFQKGHLGKLDGALASYLTFCFQEEKREEIGEEFDAELLATLSPEKGKIGFLNPWIKMIAAAIFLMAIAAGIFQINSGFEAENEQKSESELAYEEVKKALLLISTNMNEGMEHTRILGEFHKAKEELKNKND